MTTALALAHRALVRIVLWPVVMYRALLSPLKRAPSCRYLPTCSEYAIDAVHQRGVVVGGALAVWRVLRCNPLFRGGYDPVPRRSSLAAPAVPVGPAGFPGGRRCAPPDRLGGPVPCAAHRKEH